MGDRLKKNVPVLRFPEFLGDWQSNCLDQIGEFKNGFNADKQAFGSGVEFINLMDIFGKSEIQKTHLERVKIPERQLEQYKLQKGDVLFVRSSVKREGVGQSCLVNDDFENTIYSGFIIRFREKSSILNHLYKKYCFAESSFRKEILSFATSSANTNINQDSLSQIILFYPPIAEQEKIASFLGTIDTRITQLRRKHELLQTYKRGVMEKLFSQQIRFKCDRGKPFPDWEKKKIKGLGNVITGNTPSTKERSFYNGNYLFVSPADIQNKRYIYETKTTLTEQGFKQGRLVKKSSILFVCIGSTIGKIAQAGKDCITNQQINSVVVNCENNSDFVYLVLQYQSSRIKKMAGEHAVPILNKSDFQEIKLQIPFTEEQAKIADFLTAIDQKIEAISQQINLTEQFKKGLLQKMFV